WREQAFEQKITPPLQRGGVEFWAWFAKRPGLYHFAARLGMGLLGLLGKGRGRFAHLPLAGGWTAGRDMPAPEGGTFQAQWRRELRRRGRRQ
ncbi:MAG TPA: lactate utilization protein LutB domain-containing protein, partial [Candidatus Sulfotelmatobacter sp.]|nr:lactate utilization protein LutB domain-containing protein [Candidatus Sulfotelmatobacter sp.]